MADCGTPENAAILKNITIGPRRPHAEVLKLIDRNGMGVALIVLADGRLNGIVTDGDIRRAILNGDRFDEPVREFLRHKRSSIPTEVPLTASADLTRSDLDRLMRVRCVRHLPLADADGKVVGMAMRERASRTDGRPLRAVVMAGGSEAAVAADRRYAKAAPRDWRQADHRAHRRTVAGCRHSAAQRCHSFSSGEDP